MKNKSVSKIIIGAIAGIGIAAGSVAFAQSAGHNGMGTGATSTTGSMGQMNHQSTNRGMNMQMAQATMRTMQEKFSNGEMPDQASMNEMRDSMQKTTGEITKDDTSMGNMGHSNHSYTTTK